MKPENTPLSTVHKTHTQDLQPPFIVCCLFSLGYKKKLYRYIIQSCTICICIQTCALLKQQAWDSI